MSKLGLADTSSICGSSMQNMEHPQRLPTGTKLHRSRPQSNAVDSVLERQAMMICLTTVYTHQVPSMAGFILSFILSSVLLMTLWFAAPAVAQRPVISDNVVTHTLVGGGGDKCDNGLICLKDDDVYCLNNRCCCHGDYHTGDGQLQCHTKDEMVCQIISDPALITFSGDRVAIPASCKFLMAAVETKVIVKGSVVGECVIQASSWGVKGRGPGRRGKHFVGGMEIQFTVMIGLKIYYHAVRIWGLARGGVYRIREQGNRNPMFSGAYGRAIITFVPGVGSIHTTYDRHNNIAEVRGDFCGVRMGIRPSEVRQKKTEARKMAPGVYIKVNKNNEPNFLAKGKALCFSPEDKNDTLERYIEQLEDMFGKKVDEDVAMIYRILRGNTNQNFPGAPDTLQAMASAAQECTDKHLLCAIQHCLFITKDPKFLKCWSKSKKSRGGNGPGRGKRSVTNPDDDVEDFDTEGMNKSLLLMHTCMESFCGHSSMMCEVVKNTIRESKCSRFIPESQTTILDFDCNKLNT